MKLPAPSRFFHSMENFFRFFPQYGKLFRFFSTVWKTFSRFFHSMENGRPARRMAVALACAIPVGALRAEPPGEPFQTRNQNPVSRLYGWPTGHGAGAGAEAGVQLRATLDIANSSFDKLGDGHALVLDGETLVGRLSVQRRWSSGWRAALHLPWVAHGGGGLDRFIEEYHDALGLPQGPRKRQPTGVLDYRAVDSTGTRFLLDQSAHGLGDIRLAGAAPLFRNAAGTRAADLTAGLKLPTGDPDRLLGSGGTDVSLGLAASDFATLSRWAVDLHAAAGVLAMETGDILPECQRNMAGYGWFSAGWRMTSWLRPRVQLDWNSPVFSGTGLDPLDGWAVQLILGAAVHLPAGFALDIAVAEDLAVDATPDVVFHFNLNKDL